jgi:hypothetical protein
MKHINFLSPSITYRQALLSSREVGRGCANSYYIFQRLNVVFCYVCLEGTFLKVETVCSLKRWCQKTRCHNPGDDNVIFKGLQFLILIL